MTDMDPDEVGPLTRQLLRYSLGYLYSACLRVATRIDVADHLVDGPRSSVELAGLTGVDADHLHRVLRYLATGDVFREDNDGKFHLTPAASRLRADHPASLRSMVLLLTSEMYWLPAGRLEDTVSNGSTVFNEIFGMPLFDYLAGNPDAAAAFNIGVAEVSTIEQDGIVASYSFPDSGTVIDVGGGPGGLLLTVLKNNPGLNGVLYELESVLQQHLLDDPAIANRWSVESGDFFASVPAGGDIYLLKRVLHDWSDVDSLRILKSVQAAMSEHARLLIIDTVIPPGNDPHPSKISDVLMMITLDGKERTEREFDELLASADLKAVRVIPTPGPVSIIECKRM